ncbi:MAG: tetratricopeptide repeat protein [bacterium]
MDLAVLLLFIIIGAATALLVLFIFKRKPESSIDTAATDYAEGLNLLLAGDREGALLKLKEAVKKNSRNIDAYLKIGDMLRESGQIEKAINVHKYLTVRRGLNSKEIESISCSLAQDYQAAKDYDRALEVLNRTLEGNKNLTWAHEMKLRIFEQKEEWDSAFQVYREFMKNKNHYDPGRLALYKVQKGLQLIDKGKEKEAQNCFKDAIKTAPTSPPAYIYLADLHKKNNQNSEALKILRQFMEKAPEQSYLAFARIKELLYEGGKYGEIQNVYYDIIEKQPENHMARLALAENFEKKGELEKAIEMCLAVLEKDAAHKLAKKYLVRLYHKSGDNDKAVEQALNLIDESLQQKELFQCQLCGFESEEAFWRCPECHEWETFAKN